LKSELTDLQKYNQEKDIRDKAIKDALLKIQNK
jgi:hypothetical protein